MRVPDRVPGLVDSHCHLQDPAFDTDRDEVLRRAADAGIERLLVAGVDLESSRAAVRLAAAHRDLVDAAVGIHPHHAAAATQVDWDELERLAGDEGVVAIGEIGLDYHRNLSSPEQQRSAFDRQLAMAERLQLPVLVHDREAHEDIGASLLAWAGLEGARARGVLHAFSGDPAMARELTAAGFLVSFALPVAFRSATGPRQAARELAGGTFLVETDAPALGPRGAGARNEPTTVLRVAAELARLRREPIEEIATQARTAYDALIAHRARRSADLRLGGSIGANQALTAGAEVAGSGAPGGRLAFGLIIGILLGLLVVSLAVWLLVIREA